VKAGLPAILGRLREEQALQERAVLALVQLPPAGPGIPAAAQVAADLAGALRGPVEVLTVHEDEATRVRLLALNTGRDLLLRRLRAVIFVCDSGTAARFLRHTAPDLTATVDLVFDLEVEVDLSHDELGRRLQEVQGQRFRELDLSGLVPHTADVVRVSVEAVYQARRLIRPEGGARVEGGAGLLLAEPGAGKTTWMRHAAGQPSEKLALYAPLSAWVAQARERALPLFDWLEGFTGRLLGGQPVHLGPHLGQMILLLDGLDEVPGRDARRRVVEEVLALRQEHPGFVCIVAGREHVVEDLLAEQLRRLRVLRLAPVQPAQRRHLVDALLRARRGLAATARLAPDVAHLQQEILGHRDFARFGANPLLLTFLAVLADLGRGMPAQRVELYDELVGMLIVSWQKVRTASTGRRLNRADVLRVVAPLAWRLVERGVGGLTEDELLDFLVETDARESDSGAARRAARHRLEQLREDSALLLATDGLWRFHHATIAEFLAARAVLQTPAFLGELCVDPYEPRRVQVLAFALALACDLEPRDDVALPLLEALDAKARRPGRYDAKIPRVLVTCLREAHAMPAGLRKRLAAHVLRVALCKSLHPERRLDALASVDELSSLADGPIRAALEELMARPDQVDSVGIARAWSLVERDSFRLFWFSSAFHLPPVSIARAGVDATPLVRAWVSHADPCVRAMLWQAWAWDVPARWSLALSADPTLSEMVLQWEVHNTVAFAPPAAWTAVIRESFPSIPADA